MKLSPSKTAFGLGVFLALWHFVWAIMVAAGIAQAFLDFIFNLHMMTPAFDVAEFSLDRAVGLIVTTAIIGGIAGWVFAMVWNKISKTKKK